MLKGSDGGLAKGALIITTERKTSGLTSEHHAASGEANQNMWHAPQGVHDFLRAYYHMKSADWKENAPFPLKARTASEWAKLPRYYVMDLDKGMAESSPGNAVGCGHRRMQVAS